MARGRKKKVETVVLPVTTQEKELLLAEGAAQETCDGAIVNGSEPILLDDSSKLEVPVVKEGEAGGPYEGMVWVPAGPFFAGEKCQLVILTRGFWIGKTPVTNKQFYDFIQADGYKNKKYWDKIGWENYRTNRSSPAVDAKKLNDAVYDKLPVVSVNWYEARAYAAFLQEQRQLLTGEKLTFDLPFEAQWEKAARGTDKRIYPWGDQEPTADLAAFYPHAKDVMPVDSHPKGASPYGCLDMAGNVWEWCRDEWTEQYPSAPVDPFVVPSVEIARGIDQA